MSTLDFVSREGYVFTVEAVTMVSPDKPRYALRLWLEGSLINNPHEQFYTTEDAAYEEGFTKIKAYLKGKR